MGAVHNFPMQVFFVQDFELLPPFSRVASPKDPTWSQPHLGSAYRPLRAWLFLPGFPGQRGRAGCTADTNTLRSLLPLYPPSPPSSSSPSHSPSLLCFYLLIAGPSQPRPRLPTALSGSSRSSQRGKEGLFQVPGGGWGVAQVQSKADTGWV